MTANPPQVTWLLPVLNGMPYLPETLASIAAQTFRDFEVLAWDNGSTDGTAELLREWIPHRLPGRVVTGRPLDLGACLAEMVAAGASPYCARIDADDVNLPGRLAAQVAFLERNPEVAVAGCQVEPVGPDGGSLGEWGALPLAHEAIVVRMLREWGLWHPTVLFRRAAVLRAGNYLDERPVEDYSLWLRLARTGRLANLPERLVRYRVHPASVSQTANREGVLNEKRFRCIARHGAPLYGLPEEALHAIAAGRPLAGAEMAAVLWRLTRSGCNPLRVADALVEREMGKGPVGAANRRLKRALRSAFGEGVAR